MDYKKEVEKLKKQLQRVLFFPEDSKNIDFYISSLTEHNPFYTTEEVEQWINKLNADKYFEVTQIPLGDLRKWKFNDSTGDLEHASGGFFSVRGLRIKTNMGLVPEWSQPIIYQPEVGILCLAAKKINGILYFLVQAKAEPGNISTYQISPTVQATRSNYIRLHGGKAIPYLEYFIGEKLGYVLLDQLQSEQGARFFRKRNRNIIVLLGDDEKVELGENFRWLTLGQLHRLAQRNNLVNMDTRSVISLIYLSPEKTTSFEVVDPVKLKKTLEHSPIVIKPIDDFGIKLMISAHPNSVPFHTMEELLQRLTYEKCKCIVEADLIPLKNVEKWNNTKYEISHQEQKYFSVIGVRIKASDREVSSWDQPIIKQKDPGIIGFIIKEIKGVLHFLVQLKMESGVMDLLEIAPTVQCISDNYTVDNMPLFTDKFLNRGKATTIFDVYQSEEGGRFFKESNRNIVILAEESFPTKEPPFYVWLTLRQLKEFVKFNNFVNIEARSLLACLKR